MADTELIVTISGAALSLLFYENVRSVGDRMGFFLGEVLTYVTKNVTDADRHVESTRIHIDIRGILPCPSTGLMYDSTGKINVMKLHNFVGNSMNEIVGWYRFRLNGSLTPTLRDKILLKQFQNLFFSRSNIPTFITCMLNYTTTNIGGTHKFRHVFLQYKNGVYRPIPLQINNLGSDVSIPNGSDYKPTPIRHKNFIGNCFMDQQKRKLHQLSGYQAIAEIQKVAEKYLEDLVPVVCKSDYEVALLEENVMQLRSKIREKQKDRAMKIENVQSNENFMSGEPHYGMIKNVNEQHGKMLVNEESTMIRIEKEYPNRKSEIPENIQNTHSKSNDEEKILQCNKSYSGVTKGTNINTT